MSAIDSLADAIRNLALRVKRLETTEQQLQSWVAVVLGNGWANTGAPYASAGYWRDPNGQVHLRGRVTGGAGAAFTLPAHYRPEYQIVFVANGGTVTVATSGAVTPAGATVDLDAVSFRAYA